jgi:KipI family sensor histidine kinase inhibitor
MAAPLSPTVLPLGDRALLIRFSEQLSDAANRAAIAMADRVGRARLDGVEEVAPGLVSVLLRLSPIADFMRLSGEIGLLAEDEGTLSFGREHSLAIVFDGEDVDEVADQLGLGRPAFIARHNAMPLRVLATGFAPGFVYCGFHPDDLVVPRRETIRPLVPAGTVLFAAGQTAIASTPIRTGWHIIGITSFQNFDPAADPPTRLRPGDTIRFTEAP